MAISQLVYDSSSVFALFWNILRNQLPDEVIGDFEAWLKANKMLRMDTLGTQGKIKGIYTVEVGDDSFDFHDVNMPPPSGVYGVNYSRFVKDGNTVHLPNHTF